MYLARLIPNNLKSNILIALIGLSLRSELMLKWFERISLTSLLGRSMPPCNTPDTINRDKQSRLFLPIRSPMALSTKRTASSASSEIP